MATEAKAHAESMNPRLAKQLDQAEMKSELRIDPVWERSLNALVASQASLYYKTKKAHWLAAGPLFKEIHEMLDEHATFIINNVDEIAERITMLGGTPVGGLNEFSERSLFKDFDPGRAPMNEYLKALFQDHENLIVAYRNAITEGSTKNDYGTVDLLTKILQEHEKAAWYLRETIRGL